jgi:hypothetical protein
VRLRSDHARGLARSVRQISEKEPRPLGAGAVDLALDEFVGGVDHAVAVDVEVHHVLWTAGGAEGLGDDQDIDGVDLAVGVQRAASLPSPQPSPRESVSRGFEP